MRRPRGRAVFVLLTVVTLVALRAMVVMASRPISEQEAIADAMKVLPANGAGYRVVAVQLESSSKHFEFSGANGQQFGEDQVRECLVIPPLPPLPFLTPCRYYPVWVVALSSQTCDVVIAINALTGRFGGGGDGYRGDAQPTSTAPDSCGISPGGGGTAPGWWQPVWN